MEIIPVTARRHLIIGLFTAAVLLPVAGAPAANAAAAPVQCGDTLSANTTLTADLTCTAGDGLTLAPDVTLDLGGHKLTGAGAATGYALILSGDLSGGGTATLTNGTVQGWSQAVGKPIEVINAAMSKMTFIDAPVSVAALSVVDSTFLRSPLTVGDGAFDIGITRSTFTNSDVNLMINPATVESSVFTASSLRQFRSSLTVKASRFSDALISNDDAGFISVDRSTLNRSAIQSAGNCVDVAVTSSVITNYKGPGAAIDGCLGNIRGNRLAGNTVALDISIPSWSGGPGDTATSDVVGNILTGNGTAIHVTASVNFQSNVVSFNKLGFVGDAPNTSDDGRWTRVIRGNWFSNNTGNGITASSVKTNTTIGRNIAVANGGYGVYAPGVIDGGANVAVANTAGQCVGIRCTAR